MNVKDAVKKAITCVADMFSEEDIKNIGLEEVRLNEAEGVWEVTVGFTRPWDDPKSPFTQFQQMLNTNLPRCYKIVKIDNESGDVKAIEIREVTHA